MSSIQKRTQTAITEEEVKSRRNQQQQSSAQAAKDAQAQQAAAGSSLLQKSKDIGARAIEAVKDESRSISQTISNAGHKAWDATAQAASKLQEAVTEDVQAVNQALSKGLHSVKEAVVGHDDKNQAQEKSPVAKPPGDVPVLKLDHQVLDQRLKSLSIEDAERATRAAQEKISADQLHFLNQQPSGCVDALPQSVPLPPSQIPSSSEGSKPHRADRSKAEQLLGEKVPKSFVAPTDAAAITQQFDQDQSSSKYNLQPQAPAFTSHDDEQLDVDRLQPVDQRDKQQQQQEVSFRQPQADSSSIRPPTQDLATATASRYGAPPDYESMKQGLAEARVWEDIKEAAQSVKDRREEEAGDREEASAMHQVKEAVKHAGQKVLETASSVVHSVTESASHMLHRDKDKQQQQQKGAPEGSSQKQTRDAHDGAGPQTGNVKDKGELSKTSKSLKGEHDRQRAVEDSHDAVDNLKDQGSQFNEEGKKRKREGEYEPSADAGAHDKHKVIDARDVQDIVREPARKQGTQEHAAKIAGEEESLNSALIGVLTAEKPQLNRQTSGNADRSHIPRSALDDFNSQMLDAKPNEGRMLPASTEEQHAVAHTKPIIAPESGVTKDMGADERRNELVSPREMERRRKAKGQHQKPSKDKSPEEAPRPPSEQAEFDPDADKRKQEVSKSQQVTDLPTHHD